MQATTRFHDGVANPVLQEANRVLHDPIAFDSANDVFNTTSARRDATIGCLLRGRAFTATGFFLRLDDRDAIEQKTLKALLVIQATTGWQGITCQRGSALIGGFPFTGMAEEAHVTGLVDHEEVFERMAFLLATVMVLLVLWSFGAGDWSCSTIMPTRGEGGPSLVCWLARTVAHSAAVRAGSRSCCAKA
jgi:hypothetical protein